MHSCWFANLTFVICVNVHVSLSVCLNVTFVCVYTKIERLFVREFLHMLVCEYVNLFVCASR